ncbi:MAG TPA: hypothetical protein EYG18_11045 [Micavibrio sp.]|nr:hypothetical protein [Micavibrio sp.]HIL29794.1 hypothetical protein [Micavibrio sp.]
MRTLFSGSSASSTGGAILSRSATLSSTIPSASRSKRIPSSSSSSVCSWLSSWICPGPCPPWSPELTTIACA